MIDSTLDYESLRDDVIWLEQNELQSAMTFNDEGTAVLSIYLRAITAGNVMAYLPF